MFNRLIDIYLHTASIPGEGISRFCYLPMGYDKQTGAKLKVDGKISKEIGTYASQMTNRQR